MEEFCGGKGFNQAIALARAGNEVYFAGALGADGDLLLDALRAEKINVENIAKLDTPSGHAIIQIDSHGQNSIIVLAGANGEITREHIDSVLNNFAVGDLVVMQNEISNVDYLIEKAHEKQMKIAFNPSPLNERISMCDLNLVDLLFVNEIEGAAISSGNTCLEILHMLNEKYPEMSVVLTLGGNGSLYKDKTGQIYTCGIYKTAVVDTTAAGDTFTGYFISEYIKSDDAQISLEKAAIASGLSVSVKGASPSVPKRDMVDSIDRDVLSRCELF